MSVCVRVHVCVHACVCACLYVYMCLCVCVCVCVCVCFSCVCVGERAYDQVKIFERFYTYSSHFAARGEVGSSGEREQLLRYAIQRGVAVAGRGPSIHPYYTVVARLLHGCCTVLLLHCCCAVLALIVALLFRCIWTRSPKPSKTLGCRASVCGTIDHRP
jgi:hypothetical protein